MVGKSATIGSQQDSAISSGRAVVGETAAIHQPNYIPWLGYFFKIANVDKFIFLDTVAYSRGSFTNRNLIKTRTGPLWLTIPVLTSGRFGQSIAEVSTDNALGWARRHITTLRNSYAKAPYFNEIFYLLEPCYGIGAEQISLADFNIGIITTIAAYLGLNTQFIRASELDVSGCRTNLIIDICHVIGATTYLAGTGGRSYQSDAEFECAGITSLYSSFSQPTYPQLFGQFIENLSIVDALMNCGCLGTRRLLDPSYSQG